MPKHLKKGSENGGNVTQSEVERDDSSDACRGMPNSGVQGDVEKERW